MTLSISTLQRKIKSARKYYSRLKLWGSFRRLKPFSNVFGYDRGSQSIARYYIDSFMQENAEFIRGSVLEIGDDTYTIKYGKEISHSDVLHVQPGNPKATIVADLTCADHLPANQYDCILLPQTLPFIYDFRAALYHTHRMLKPGGTMLVTLSGISQISGYDMERWGDYWRFTSLSAKKLFEEFFPMEHFHVSTYGNVLSAMAFIEGLASRELKKKELDYIDPNYQVTITVRATKPI
ncbi:MAG: methyltransferase domain-containing protein [Bacteroidota bacterium]|nr:methyltransferase domain-containing protein [Bacteroidota bacterium]